MSPPGKKSGVTTYASVVKARRTPLISTTAWSSSFSSTSLRNAGRKQRAISSAVIFPPLPCPSRIRSPPVSGSGQLAANPDSRRAPGFPGRAERWGEWGAMSGLNPDSRRAPGSPGRAERWGEWGAMSGPPTSDDIGLTERHVHQIPHDVIEGDVRLLDAMDAERRHDEGVLGQARQPPAVLARERDGQQPELARDLEAVHEIRRLAAGAERQRHVITAAEQTKLVAEDLGEVAVVRDRREQRGVGGQRERRQRAPLFEDRVAELHRHVLGVGGAAAVAHDVEPAAALEGRRHRARQGLDALGLHAEECLLDRSTLARLAEDRLFHGAAASRCRPYA